MINYKSKRMWLFYFGFASVLIILGFFTIFNYYANTPEHLEIEKGELVVDRPPFPFYSVFLVVLGTSTFLTAKYFYEKYKTKRGGENGEEKKETKRT